MKFFVVFLSSLLFLKADPTKHPSLKEAAKGLFEIGVGLNVQAATDPAATDLLKHHFHYVTPENCMKPVATQNENGFATFQKSDRFMNFAGRNKLKVVGHCLVWAKDDRTPEWFYNHKGENAPRPFLADRMKSHMGMILGRYGHKIDQWDVVNEALASNDEVWRQSRWLEI